MKNTEPTLNEVIEEFAIYLSRTEQSYEVIEKNSNRIYRRTTRIIKTVFSVIGILLVVNMYFIYGFGNGILSMVSSMEQMYTHFGKMSVQVSSITRSVEKMSSHVDVLPEMATSIDNINQDMVHMSKSFEQVNKDMDNVENSVNDISRPIPKF